MSRARLQAYVDSAKDRLGLGNWEIEVVDEPVEDPANDYAHIDPNDYADIAVLRFGPKFWESSDDKRRRIVAHELAHLHAYRTTDFVAALKKHVPKDVWELFFEEFERKEDVMIEDLAKLFAPMLPPLRIGRGKRK